MIEFLFTIDYEIYGNGAGSLSQLVHQPTRELKKLFDQHGAKFVTFVEIAELEKIDAFGTDSAIGPVKKQVRELHREGFEIGLHLHPQWSNARYEDGQWSLDLSEYNLCTLSRERIVEIVDRSLTYMRDVIGEPQFTPLSFRAGNWLFQPTKAAAGVLAEKGIKVDSSVFKGGLQRKNKLDYRESQKNGYFWSFRDDVNRPDPRGTLIEVPIHSEMVAPWRMATSKRMAYKNQYNATSQNHADKIIRSLDFLRFRYPLKLDFCRMTLDELTCMLDRVILQDTQSSESYKPIVAIGHSKDLSDFGTIYSFLSYLRRKGIAIVTFESVLAKAKELARLN